MVISSNEAMLPSVTSIEEESPSGKNNQIYITIDQTETILGPGLHSSGKEKSSQLWA